MLQTGVGLDLTNCSIIVMICFSSIVNGTSTALLVGMATATSRYSSMIDNKCVRYASLSTSEDSVCSIKVFEVDGRAKKVLLRKPLTAVMSDIIMHQDTSMVTMGTVKTGVKRRRKKGGKKKVRSGMGEPKENCLFLLNKYL